MKRLFKYRIGVALLTIALCSCQDWLETKPLSFADMDSAFSNYEGLKAGTHMLNRDIRFLDYYPTSFSQPPYFLSELFFSDLAVSGLTDTNNPPQDLNRQITPSANLSSAANAARCGAYWEVLYKGIRYANTILAYTPSAHFDNVGQRKEIEAIAYFHRAWRYYRLVHQFGDVPLITTTITEPRYNFYTTRRETILRLMKANLDSSAQYIPELVSKGMVSRGAVYHLLTKINLALGEFDDAVATASKVIDGGVHRLMTQRFGKDATDLTKNVIWDLHRSENKALPANTEVLYMVLDRFGEEGSSKVGLEIMRQVLPWYSASNMILTPDGQPAFVDNDDVKNPYLELYGRGLGALRSTWYHTNTIWQNDENDLRHAKGNWINMTDLVYNNPALKGKSEWYHKPLQMRDAQGRLLCNDTIRCWVGWPHYKVNVPNNEEKNWRGGNADWYVFRLAETYLLRAEAYVWKGQKDKAIQDINAVRVRAGATQLSPDMATIRTVLDERARELFYEEPRKCELTRIAYIYALTGIRADNGKNYKTNNFSTNNFFYDHINSTNNFYNKGTQTAKGNEYTMSPYHVLWPVPLDAILVNVQGHINQNIGYEGSESNIPPIDRAN